MTFYASLEKYLCFIYIRAIAWFVVSILFLGIILGGNIRICADSVYYAGAAQNLAENGQLSLPLVIGRQTASFLTNGPPLYALLLSLFAVIRYGLTRNVFISLLIHYFNNACKMFFIYNNQERC